MRTYLSVAAILLALFSIKQFLDDNITASVLGCMAVLWMSIYLANDREITRLRNELEAAKKIAAKYDS
ncbi:hypothetical protein GCM10010404_80810 [Nonomuraea africana]|uniref:YiaAB two helix domain-containing protein n=1 Tax=Nonomuraea africana TaxID=46171 RepID=A0ABR9KWY1_9ACTN|nr:hypothetical protein [Nonomuraea africana]MBE1566541.1 hypothetical protein [Nonomuraea africana]